MLSKSFQLVPCLDFEAWDQFVEGSLQGSVFSTSAFFKLQKRSPLILKVLKGAEFVAGLVLLASEEDGSKLEFRESFPYHGLLFKRWASELSTYRIGQEEFAIGEFVSQELFRRFSRIALSLSPHFKDLRPFQWLNYHGPKDEEKFKIDFRVSTCVYLSSTEPRGEIRSDPIPSSAEALVAPYRPLIDEHKAVFLKSSEDPHSGNLYLIDTKRAYYFGGSRTEKPRLEDLTRLSEAGIRELDSLDCTTTFNSGPFKSELQVRARLLLER